MNYDFAVTTDNGKINTPREFADDMLLSYQADDHLQTLNSQILEESFAGPQIETQNQLRTTIVSTDSFERRMVTKTNNLKGKSNDLTRKKFLMNRLNWMSYLKILYDQLEKVKDPVLTPREQKRSFLSDTILNQMSGAQSEQPDKVRREHLVMALNKIIGLLPLINRNEYLRKFKNEQAISFLQIENSIMCCPLTLLSWDSIIDLLLNVNQQQFLETIKQEKAQQNIDFNTDRQFNDEYLDSNSCKMSGVSPFDNSSQMSKDGSLFMKQKFENFQRKMHVKNFPKTQAHTNKNSLNSSPVTSRHNVETFGLHSARVEESPVKNQYAGYGINTEAKAKNNKESDGKLSDIDDCSDSDCSQSDVVVQTGETEK
jgi:hypothetical protein